MKHFEKGLFLTFKTFKVFLILQCALFPQKILGWNYAPLSENSSELADGSLTTVYQLSPPDSFMVFDFNHNEVTIRELVFHLSQGEDLHPFGRIGRVQLLFFSGLEERVSETSEVEYSYSNPYEGRIKFKGGKNCRLLSIKPVGWFYPGETFLSWSPHAEGKIPLKIGIKELEIFGAPPQFNELIQLHQRDLELWKNPIPPLTNNLSKGNSQSCFCCHFTLVGIRGKKILTQKVGPLPGVLEKGHLKGELFLPQLTEILNGSPPQFNNGAKGGKRRVNKTSGEGFFLQEGQLSGTPPLRSPLDPVKFYAYEKGQFSGLPFELATRIFFYQKEGDSPLYLFIVHCGGKNSQSSFESRAPSPFSGEIDLKIDFLKGPLANPIFRDDPGEYFQGNPAFGRWKFGSRSDGVILEFPSDEPFEIQLEFQKLKFEVGRKPSILPIYIIYSKENGGLGRWKLNSQKSIVFNWNPWIYPQRARGPRWDPPPIGSKEEFLTLFFWYLSRLEWLETNGGSGVHSTQWVEEALNFTPQIKEFLDLPNWEGYCAELKISKVQMVIELTRFFSLLGENLGLKNPPFFKNWLAKMGKNFEKILKNSPLPFLWPELFPNFQNQTELKTLFPSGESVAFYPIQMTQWLKGNSQLNQDLTWIEKDKKVSLTPFLKSNILSGHWLLTPFPQNTGWQTLASGTGILEMALSPFTKDIQKEELDGGDFFARLRDPSPGSFHLDTPLASPSLFEKLPFGGIMELRLSLKGGQEFVEKKFILPLLGKN